MQNKENSTEISHDGEDVRLEQWSIVVKDPWQAPEQQSKYLNGIIYNHPDLPDGEKVTTSRLLEIDLLDFKWAITRSRRYALGEMSPDFKKYLEKIANGKV